ncbi:Cgl0159 family (beta/alpha)8-fold protein [Actinomadura rugatobispora]|uniref:Aldolase n=1 Tax=Actinomadura rugatobispora TaxID=1994 RepID=A0ABW1A6Y4_9ACTN
MSGNESIGAGAFAARYAELVEVRAARPQAIAEAAARRVRPPAPPGAAGPLMIIAADHPARGALAAGPAPLAMGDRRDLLERVCAALARPGVSGVLGTPDVIEDLLLLGALDGKFAIGSMNRGGLAGAAFEIDDRFTAYTAAAIAAAGLDGGKMLLRLDLSDPATARTLESCAHAVTGLAGHGLMAMVEPFLSARRGDGRVGNLLTPEAMIKAIAIASGLGATSARTWLKVPVVDRMEEVMAASTLPALLLGGEVTGDPGAALAGWKAALALPSVRGLVVGRTLLYPPDDDVAGAVDAAVGVL